MSVSPRTEQLSTPSILPAMRRSVLQLLVLCLRAAGAQEDSRHAGVLSQRKYDYVIVWRWYFRSGCREPPD